MNITDLDEEVKKYVDSVKKASIATREYKEAKEAEVKANGDVERTTNLVTEANKKANE
jgi:hypothetical protein